MAVLQLLWCFLYMSCGLPITPFMLQWLHLVSFLGIKDMGITDIKRVLRLYFIQQLAKDELVRSENMLDPDFHYDQNTDGINGLSDLYREALRNENSQGLDRAAEVAEAFALSLDPSTSVFKRFYREFIKIELQLLAVLLKRECSDYSDEVKYLYGDETGLSDPAFGSYEADSQPLETLSLITHAITVADKQAASGRAGGVARRQEAELVYEPFDACVLEMSKEDPSHTDAHIARTCSKRTSIDRSERSFRARVNKIRMC
jgi:hypothetical protein